MVKCPECSNEIDYVDVNVKSYRTYTVDVDLDSDVGLNWEKEWDRDGENDEIEAYCPSCNHFLFSDEGELEDFLRGVKMND